MSACRERWRNMALVVVLSCIGPFGCTTPNPTDERATIAPTSASTEAPPPTATSPTPAPPPTSTATPPPPTSTATPPPPTKVPTPVAPPFASTRFSPSTLIEPGVQFENDSLFGQEGAWGAFLLSSAVEPEDGKPRSLVHRTYPTHADFAVSTLFGESEDGAFIWQVESVWRLEFPLGSQLTIAGTACTTPPSFEDHPGFFVAVTDESWEVPLGGWSIGLDGPVRLPGALEISCEQFRP